MSETTVERRIVTVLFADLVGFTSLSEQLDPEDVAVIQDEYFASVRETIGRYGGRLEKFIGDAAMAVFGIPVTRDDDAERAARAGLALVSSVQQLSARLGLEAGTLRLRVGVNSGEVIHKQAGVDEGRVTGDTVNVAARFQAAAEPDRVLVGETTALAVAEAVELQETGALELKGKAQPVRAWAVEAVRPERSRDHAMGRLRAPLIGRERELDVLHATLARIGPQRVEGLLIVAPPGVGKTRLVDELARACAATVPAPPVLRARLRPDVLAPYDVVGQLLVAGLALAEAREDATGPTREQAALVLRERLAAARVPPARAAVVEDEVLAAAWPTDDDAAGGGIEDREALFAAWLEGLDALAGARSVWIVEDLHWAGGDVLALLDHARRGGSAEGRLVVATARPSLLERAPEWCAEAPARSVLHLPTLAGADAKALVAALVGDALPDELLARLVARSDGNPLFIEELLRTWISVGFLSSPDGEDWRLSASPDEVALPTTVQGIYAAQIDDLSREARLVVRRAAVAGRTFPLRALEPLGAGNCRDGLEVLRTRALVGGPTPERLFGDTYSYRHALLRDAGYASLARAERAQLHVRLARWLEQAAGARSADVAEVIGRNYEAALDAVPALAAEVGDGLDRAEARRLAALWFERAAEAALALAAHEAARPLFQRSLELTDESGVLDRARRLQRLGEITAFAADMQTGSEAVAEAVELWRSAAAASDASDHERDAATRGYAQAVASLAEIRIAQLRFGDARALVQEALPVAPAVDQGTARLLILRGSATIALENDVEAASADSQRALALARKLHDPALELEARAWLSRMHVPDLPVLSSVDWAEVEHLAREQRRWATAAASIEAQALIALIGDRPGEVVRLADRMTEAAATYGLTESIGWADYLRTEAHAVLGNWDGAVETGLGALGLAERYGYHRVAVRTWMVLAPLGAGRGDRELGDHLVGWWFPRRSKLPSSPFSRIAHTVFDIHLARLGFDVPPALPPEDVLPAFSIPWGHPSFFAERDDLVRAWLDRGLNAAARAALERVEAIPAATRSSLGRATTELLRARVGAAEGDDAGAKSATAALGTFRALGTPWWSAKAIRLLDSLGQADRSLVEEARGIEEHLGLVAAA